MQAQYLEAGRIVNTHGVHGEVKLEPWADSAAFLAPLRRFYLDGEALRVERSRVHGRFLIVKFADTDDVNAAMRLKNKTVFLDRGDVKLPAGGFFLADLIGAAVVTESGEALGTLTEILEKPAGNIYVVRGEREFLIPAVPAFIRKTDAVHGVVTVRLIEGL